MASPRRRILAVAFKPSRSRPARLPGSLIIVQKYGERSVRASLMPSRNAAIKAITGCRMKRNDIGSLGRLKRSRKIRSTTSTVMPYQRTPAAGSSTADAMTSFGRRLSVLDGWHRPLGGFRQSTNAAEPDMAHRAVDRFRVTRGRTIAAAVIRRAEVRTALEHFAGDLDFR